MNSEKRNKDLQLRTMENDMRQHEKLLSTIRENVDEQQAKIDVCNICFDNTDQLYSGANSNVS